MYLDHDGWNLIFYTGKKSLSVALEKSNTNIRIIKGRPNLPSVVSNIVYGIESGEGRPEKYTVTSFEEMKKLVIKKSAELDRITDMRSTEKINKLSDYVETLGFSFTEIIEEIKRTNQEQFAESKSKMCDAQVLLESEPEGRAEHVLEHLRSSSINLGFLESDTSSHSSGSHKDVDQTSSGHNENEQGAGPVRGLTGRKFERKGSMTHWKSMAEVCSRRHSNEVIKPAFKPWEKNETQEKCVRRLDKDHIMSTWGMMYCGGSQPVIETLKEISIDYRLDLHIDSFAW